MNNKFLSNLWAWGTSASYSDTTVSTWLAGLVLVLILAFLWSTVVAKIAHTSETVVNSVGSAV